MKKNKERNLMLGIIITFVVLVAFSWLNNQYKWIQYPSNTNETNTTTGTSTITTTTIDDTDYETQKYIASTSFSSSINSATGSFINEEKRKTQDGNTCYMKGELTLNAINTFTYGITDVQFSLYSEYIDKNDPTSVYFTFNYYVFSDADHTSIPVHKFIVGTISFFFIYSSTEKIPLSIISFSYDEIERSLIEQQLYFVFEYEVWLNAPNL